MTITVRVYWTVSKDFEVEAKTKEEALQKVRDKIDRGEVCVWTDGFETTDYEHAYIPDGVGKD